jgi:hypothetical protein
MSRRRVIAPAAWLVCLVLSLTSGVASAHHGSGPEEQAHAIAAVLGQYKHNGSYYPVICYSAAGSRTPGFASGNTRLITYVGAVKCTSSYVTINSVRGGLYASDGVQTLAPFAYCGPSAGLNGCHGGGYYQRPGPRNLQRVGVASTMSLPADGTARWNYTSNSCTISSSPTVDCGFKGPAFLFFADTVPEGIPPLKDLVCESYDRDCIAEVQQALGTLIAPYVGNELAAAYQDLADAPFVGPEEQGGNLTMAIVERLTDSTDPQAELLLAAFAGVAGEESGFLFDTVDGTAGLVLEATDVATDALNGPLAQAAASREFYRQSAAWGRAYYSRVKATNELPAQHRPQSAGTDGDSGSDCTIFVSNAWHLGGGLAMDNQRKPSVAQTRDWFTGFNGASVLRSVPWVRVTSFYNYWVYKRKRAATRVVSPTDRNPAIAIGDVIQINQGGGRGFSHASLIESMSGRDKIVQWSRDLGPGTPWNEFYYERTPRNQKARVRTRVVHMT